MFLNGPGPRFFDALINQYWNLILGDAEGKRLAALVLRDSSEPWPQAVSLEKHSVMATRPQGICRPGCRAPWSASIARSLLLTIYEP